VALGLECDLRGHLRTSAAGVVNYQAWTLGGQQISSSGVEGAVSRLIGRLPGKGQHVCWTKTGAHLLLQFRCALLNNELLTVVRRWYWEEGSSCTALPGSGDPSMPGGA
jgi:hypothetical protein